MAEEVGLCVRYGDGGRELLYMTPVNENRYRLEVTSICGHLRYGDTIEVGTPLADGSVPYRRIVKRSVSRHTVLFFRRGCWRVLEFAAFGSELIRSGVTAKALPVGCLLFICPEIAS